MKKISIIGQGYVGLTLAIAASKHFNVVGFDNNAPKISLLADGISYVEDVSSTELSEAIRNGSYLPTNQVSEMENSDIFVICVPTPLNSERQPDLTYIEEACESIRKILNKPALIINESTSYPGTLREFIKPNIEKSGIKDCLYAVAPERVDPGRTDFTVETTPRLLAGLDKQSENAALEFYNQFCSNMILVPSPEVAETAKLFENTFRQVNIALVNELAIISDALNISVYDVLNAAETKPYGFMRFNPGPGVGGHCIPIDPTYLAYSAHMKGATARFIELANQVNLDMPNFILKRCIHELSTLKGKKVLLAGISYKSNISDTRESPAETIYSLLKEAGAQVFWYDPLVEDWRPNKIVDLQNENFDLAIFQTVHDVMDLSLVRKSANVIFDCTGKITGAIHL